MIEAFKKALASGNLAEVRRLLEGHGEIRASINAPLFAFDQRPVSRVAANLPMVDLLLEYDADLNQKSGWWAGGWGILETAEPDIAAELIQRGAIVDIFAAAHLDKLERLRELLDADPALANAKGGDGCRPLHFARSAQAMDLLLARGGNIDARDVDHEATAAQWAVPWLGIPRDSLWAAIIARLRRYIDRGATVDIFMAAALGDAALLQQVIARDPAAIGIVLGQTDYPPCPGAPGGHIYIYRFSEGMIPYQVAMEFGHADCAALLLAAAMPKQRFLAVCSVGDAPAARALLADRPALMGELTPRDCQFLANAAWSGKAAAVQLMLDLGFDPAAKGPGDSTALHRAAWRGHHQIIHILLTHPASQNRLADLVGAIDSTHHTTPLHWCFHGSTNCRNPHGDYPAIARMLLEAGADPGTSPADASEAVRAALGRNSA